MRQVIVIHGGSTYDTREDFLTTLKNKVIDLDYLRSKRDWKSSLAEGLGEDYEVFLLQMPNKQNAKYEEWKIWFEKVLQLLNEKLILVGHSLGGIFIAKYLSEQSVDKDIQGSFLVGAPYDMSDRGGTLADFALPQSLRAFAEQSRIVHLYHSTEDPIVPFADLAKFQKKLPYARASVFDDRGHFNIEEFPEIVADIKALG